MFNRFWRESHCGNTALQALAMAFIKGSHRADNANESCGIRAA
jgi:hypothetical protein